MILQMAQRSVAKSQAPQACPMVTMWPWDMCGAVAGASRLIWQESRSVQNIAHFMAPCGVEHVLLAVVIILLSDHDGIWIT